MQPLALTFPGQYWDSWVYRGHLYLWRLDNSVLVYDLDAVVEHLSTPGTRFPLLCAFSQGDYLYGERWKLAFSDPDLRNMIVAKFASSPPYLEAPSSPGEYVVGEYDSPFRSLHDDCEFYKNDIYALTDEGLFSATTRRRSSKRPIGAQAKKLWDAPCLSLTAGYSRLAIAAGSEGLFEIDVTPDGTALMDNAGPKQVSKNHTLYANWAFASLYGTSDLGHGYLAGYDWTAADWGNDRRRIFDRRFVRVVYEEEIFGKHTGLSWASQEKILLLTGTKLRITKFTQRFLRDPEKGDPFSEVGSVNVRSGEHRIISARTAMFGTILEFENKLLVIRSDQKLFSVKDRITRWRVFPRSVRYENQLHVITSDAATIYSFNHDYFVSQEKKITGTAWNREFRNNKRSRTVWGQ